MGYLDILDWKKTYHPDEFKTLCRSNCAWCKQVGGPGWQDFDNCTFYNISLIADYSQTGKFRCETCEQFIPKTDKQVCDLYDEYVAESKRKDLGRNYDRDAEEFKIFTQMQDLGIVSDADPEQFNEGFSEDYDGEINV